MQGRPTPVLDLRDCRTLVLLCANRKTREKLLDYFLFVECKFYESERTTLGPEDYTEGRKRKRDLQEAIASNTSDIETSTHDMIANNLASKYNGKREASNLSGVSDIETDTYCIEVKQVDKAHHALGQALCYASSQKKLPWVHLFGHKPPPPEVMIFVRLCLCSVCTLPI